MHVVYENGQKIFYPIKYKDVASFQNTIKEIIQTKLCTSTKYILLSITDLSLYNGSLKHCLTKTKSIDELRMHGNNNVCNNFN